MAYKDLQDFIKVLEEKKHSNLEITEIKELVSRRLKEYGIE